jgi:hypothetical protein
MALPSGDVVQNNRSDSPTVPGNLKPTEQTFLKETDLQRRIESLQRIICDLLIENERLRQHRTNPTPKQILEGSPYEKEFWR